MYKNKSYAKINLDLNVIDKRKDGYHNLSSIMTNVNLFDELEYESLKESNFLVTSNYPEINNENNLVIKISKYMFDRFHINGGISIKINKNIPIAAGMAGGSGNGAATIRAINDIYNLGLSTKNMAEIGILFGSDIPFCVYGGCQLVEGKGDKITKINNKLEFNILVIKNNFPIFTRDVFNNIEKFDDTNNIDLIRSLESNNYELMSKNIYNGLEKVTSKLNDDVCKLINKLKKYGYVTLLSGSGPTVLCFFDEVLKLDEAYKKVLENGYTCFKCKNIV